MVVLLFIVLVIFHLRYPFLVNENEAWSIGYGEVENPTQKFVVGASNIIDYKSIDFVTEYKTEFLADPFLVIENDIFYIFFEHKGKGNADIALLTSRDGKAYQYKGIVLDEPFHLSFPQVFKYRGEFYMLPEAKQSENLILYRANNFPYDWEITDTLIHNKRLEDPALLLSDSLNIISASDVSTLTQYLYTSDSLRGNWEEHSGYNRRRGNETRAGGSFFEYDNRWFLPLQNNNKGYGTSLSLYELKGDQRKLRFEKVLPLILEPHFSIKWFETGMHHLDIEELNDGYYVVYDGKRKINDEKKYNYKASIKYNFYDIYNFFKKRLSLSVIQ